MTQEKQQTAKDTQKVLNKALAQPRSLRLTEGQRRAILKRSQDQARA